ncbi:hypothetical protein E8E11_000194 [Didymella keratinophila]|nr:hypothetical protein E8E11_000194 [Didymella keratinophila]
MSFLFTPQATGPSFTQLRKLGDFREYEYAQDAAYSLKHFSPEPFDLSVEIDRQYAHVLGTLNAVKFDTTREGKIEKPSNKVRWADKAKKAAMKRQRRGAGVWTDEARRALIANLARERW